MLRCFFDSGKKVSKVKLHGFSNASDMAYAGIVYLRVIYETGEVSIRFVATNAKVCPITKQCAPRLEILGSQSLARSVRTVEGGIGGGAEGMPINAFYWVDSIASLCGIKNDKVWVKFVRHRVSDILNDSQRNEWFHCPVTQNPINGNVYSLIRTKFFLVGGSRVPKMPKC